MTATPTRTCSSPTCGTAAEWINFARACSGSAWVRAGAVALLPSPPLVCVIGWAVSVRLRGERLDLVNRRQFPFSPAKWGTRMATARGSPEKSVRYVGREMAAKGYTMSLKTAQPVHGLNNLAA